MKKADIINQLDEYLNAPAQNTKNSKNVIAKSSSIDKKMITKVVNSFIDVISNYLAKGEGQKVTLAGFCSFHVKPRKACKGRNPSTGEIIQIKAAKRVAISPGQRLKNAINGVKKTKTSKPIAAKAKKK